MDEIVRLIQAEIAKVQGNPDPWLRGSVSGMRYAIYLIEQYCNAHRCYCDELNQHPPADGEVLEEIGG